MSEQADRAATVERLAGDLRASGVAEGDRLAVGVSLKAVGCGPEAMVDALRAAVGPSGTVMANAYTTTWPTRQVEAGKGEAAAVFDPATTPAYTGALANHMLGRSDSIRSTHPACSVVAIGAAACALTDGHDAAAGAYWPYSRLAELGGKVMAIGIGDALVGFRHEAQALAGLLAVVPGNRAVRYRDSGGSSGAVRVFERPDRGGCIERLPGLVGELRAIGGVVDGRVGGATSVLVDADAGLRFHADRLRTEPQRYLCDDERCVWCRELERRMKLYRRVLAPHGWQSSRLWRMALAVENRYRLRDAEPPRLVRRMTGVLRRLGRKLGV